MELGNTIIWGVSKTTNRFQPNTSEDTERYFTYQALKQALLLPTRAEPMGLQARR